VLLRVWDKFRAHGIQFPYPQREVHLKTPVEVTLREPHETAVERTPEREETAGRPSIRPRSSTGG